MKSSLARLAIISMMFVAAPFIAGAQDNSPQDQGTSDQAVKLQPGVARVSFAHGDVSSQRGDNGEWVPASLNTPIAQGDRIATGQKSRAELQLDWADILRMSDSATANVASLSRTNIQLQVGQGLVTYNVLKGTEANSQIDTPNASIRPEGPGEYRILVNSDAETQVTVRDGSAEISTPQGSTRVEKGQMITVAGTDNPQYQTASAPGKDDWDGWNNDRNKRISSAESWRKTDRYYTGSEDLDAYGRWSEVPDYGPVWVPAEGPGWAPYRDGRWVYEPYYGWTWVSYEPWGWAPYHYGRWFVYGGDWAWWPGPVYGYPDYYPVWAPAYVSFFGYGGGGWDFSFGFGFGGYGNYGWLPCGPGDWYHPWYGGWGRNGGFVNVTNVYNRTVINNYPTRGGWRNGFAPLGGRFGSRYSNINEALRNERVRGGISSMSASEFGRREVSAHQGRMSEAAFRQANLVTGRMPVNASRESFSPSGTPANPAAYRSAPPATQHFFNGGPRSVGSVNPSPQPPSRSVGASRGPFGGNSNVGLRPHDQLPSGRGSNSGNPANSGPSQPTRPGWHSFTPPTSSGGTHFPQSFHASPQQAQNNPRQPSTPATPRGSTSQTRTGSPQQDRGGWQHFTPPAHSASSAAPQTHAGTPQQDRGGWQHFTPPSRQAQPQGPGRGFEQQGSPQQHGYRSPAPAQSPRGYNSSPYSYQRPPLNMQQPIVRPRQGNYGYGAPRGSYSQPRGGYGGPSGGYSSPRGGGYSAPRGGGYSAPRGGGYSAPRGGGGSSNRGGGSSNGRGR